MPPSADQLSSDTYNPANESVYYVKIPKVAEAATRLLKISLAEQFKSPIPRRRREARVPASGYSISPSTLDRSLTNGFKPLTPIHRRKMISVDVRFVVQKHGRR